MKEVVGSSNGLLGLGGGDLVRECEPESDSDNEGFDESSYGSWMCAASPVKKRGVRPSKDPIHTELGPLVTPYPSRVIIEEALREMPEDNVPMFEISKVELQSQEESGTELVKAEILHFVSHMGELRKEFVFGDASHNSSIVVGDMACVEGNDVASVGGNSVASDRR
ncbi:hypothetical protein ACOSQ3_013985 [Xanthoceras sorbifolium]